MKKKFRNILLAAMAVVMVAADVSAAAYSAVVGNYDRRGAIDRSTAPSAFFGEDDIPQVGESENAWKRVNGLCYNPNGDVITGAITRGIDVSEWNGVIDWNKVKTSDVDFAFVRISYGASRLDYNYDYNMQAANAAGVPVGTYVYGTAKTQEGVLKEAQTAIRKMNGYKVSYPVVYDMEMPSMESMSSEELSLLALTFCDEVRKAGYYPMVYCSASWYTSHLDTGILSDIDFWIASYSDTSTGPNRSKYNNYTIWQCSAGDTISYNGKAYYSTKGLIDGIPGNINVDMNFGYVDYSKIITPRTYTRSDYTPSSTAAGYTGWVTNGSNKYYYRDGSYVKGSQYIDSKLYYFSTSDGHLITDSVVKISDGKFIYADSDGVAVSNKWITSAGNTYYFGSDCYAYRGVRQVGDAYYYFLSSTGVMQKSYLLRSSNGLLSYFGSDGKRVTNKFVTLTDSSNNYTGKWYFDGNGRAYKGWHVVNHRKYYFYPGKSYRSGSIARSVTVKIGRYTYTFDANGKVTKKELK